MKLNKLELIRERAFIDGEWVAAQDGASFDVVNPASGQRIGAVSSVGLVETEQAIVAAHRAGESWRKMTGKDRSQILRQWYNLIMQNSEDLARLLSLEQGKPLAESRGEIVYGASFIEWYAEEAKRIYGDVIPNDKPGRRLVCLKQPVGVVAAITPWNFPNAMITRKVAPALAAGCTVVVKPASETPLSALALAWLAQQAGVPRGVINVVTSQRSREVGEMLTTHPLVRKLSFTGSTQIGRLLMAQCASTIKKVSLELGGNAPFIVFDDADLDLAVKGALASKFRNSGQTCVCTNRIFVQQGIYQAFTHRLAEAVKQLRVGPADEEGSQQGPLINQHALAKVQEHIADAVSLGAELLAGGGPHERGGNFFQPTVLGNVTTTMKVAQEETFGPLAAIFRFETEAEAVKLANDTEYGLAAYVYTQDLSRAWRVSEAIESGMVGINEGLISTEVAPFGGIKQSGMGREGSRYGIEDFLELKYLCMGINESPDS